MKEKAIEQYLCQQVKKRGGKAYKFTSPAHRGVPDRIIVMPNGILIFCEVKNESGVLSLLQKLEIKWLRAHGHKTAIVWSKEDVDTLMEVIDELVR